MQKKKPGPLISIKLLTYLDNLKVQASENANINKGLTNIPSFSPNYFSIIIPFIIKMLALNYQSLRETIIFLFINFHFFG